MYSALSFCFCYYFSGLPYSSLGSALFVTPRVTCARYDSRGSCFPSTIFARSRADCSSVLDYCYHFRMILAIERSETWGTNTPFARYRAMATFILKPDPKAKIRVKLDCRRTPRGTCYCRVASSTDFGDASKLFYYRTPSTRFIAESVAPGEFEEITAERATHSAR